MMNLIQRVPQLVVTIQAKVKCVWPLALMIHLEHGQTLWSDNVP